MSLDIGHHTFETKQRPDGLLILRHPTPFDVVRWLEKSRAQIIDMRGKHPTIAVQPVSDAVWAQAFGDLPTRTIQRVPGGTQWHVDPGFTHVLLANPLKKNSRGAFEFVPKAAFMGSVGQVCPALARPTFIDTIEELYRASFLAPYTRNSRLDGLLDATGQVIKVDWREFPMTLLIVANEEGAHRAVYNPSNGIDPMDPLIKSVWV